MLQSHQEIVALQRAKEVFTPYDSSYVQGASYDLHVGEKVYINTKHNSMISKDLSIDRVLNRCPSFVPFYNFVKEYCC